MIIVRSCPIRSVQKYRASEELLCTTYQRENFIIVCSIWGVHGVRTVYESSFYLIADELIRMHKGCSRLHSIQCLKKLLVHDKQNNIRDRYKLIGPSASTMNTKLDTKLVGASASTMQWIPISSWKFLLSLYFWTIESNTLSGRDALSRTQWIPSCT